MIEVINLAKHFGGLIAIDNVSLSIKKNSITGLIGPNGAGKTTLFNLIAGQYQPSDGKILLDGEDVTGLEPHQLFKKGLLRTFQLSHEFATMSVLENLMMVPDQQMGEKLIHTWFNRQQIAKQEKDNKKKAESVIEFLNMGHLMYEKAGNLSGGQKKLLELGRTMMTDAKVVLLDEVGAGVNRTLLNEIGHAIKKLHKENGYTFCMIEHDIDFISNLCDHVIVMADGRLLTQGDINDIKKDQQVIDAYLGTGIKKQ